MRRDMVRNGENVRFSDAEERQGPTKFFEKLEAKLKIELKKGGAERGVGGSASVVNSGGDRARRV